MLKASYDLDYSCNEFHNRSSKLYSFLILYVHMYNMVDMAVEVEDLTISTDQYEV